MSLSSFKCLLFSLSLLHVVVAQNLGKWSEVIQFPLIPVGAFIVPEFPESNRLLMFSSNGNHTFGGRTGKTQFGDFNFRNRQFSFREVSNTQHDMFCPGIASLPDNRVLISGGADNTEATLYTPSSNSFADAGDMALGRGYHVQVTLSNGKVFTVGGSWSGRTGNKDGEQYDPSTNVWTSLPGCDSAPALTRDQEGENKGDNHMWLYAWRNGFVFQAGPSRAMNWFSTSGSGAVRGAGTRDSASDAMNGVHAMYDAGKIFVAGGSPHYTGHAALKRAYIITIGEPNTNAAVERVADMNFARGVANAVVLPDGKVLITGGQTDVRTFTDQFAVQIPELWDPVTKTFTQVARESVPRNYHSVSLLLSDGRVFSGGGGLCFFTDTRCTAGNPNHPDAQIYSPPYLFDSNGNEAPRPVISRLSATSVRPGGTLDVTVEGSSGLSGYTYSLIRLGSVTHAINSDQRRISVTGSSNGQTVSLSLPGDSGILIPGAYYVFVLSPSGVPSIAKTINIQL